MKKLVILLLIILNGFALSQTQVMVRGVFDYDEHIAPDVKKYRELFAQRRAIIGSQSDFDLIDVSRKASPDKILEGVVKGFKKIKDLKKDNKPPYILSLNFSSHGSQGNICTQKGRLIYKDLIQTITTQMKRDKDIKLNITISACYGGSFIDEIKKAGLSDRVVAVAGTSGDHLGFAINGIGDHMVLLEKGVNNLLINKKIPYDEYVAYQKYFLSRHRYRTYSEDYGLSVAEGLYHSSTDAKKYIFSKSELMDAALMKESGGKIKVPNFKYVLPRIMAEENINGENYEVFKDFMESTEFSKHEELSNLKKLKFLYDPNIPLAESDFIYFLNLGLDKQRIQEVLKDKRVTSEFKEIALNIVKELNLSYKNGKLVIPEELVGSTTIDRFESLATLLENAEDDQVKIIKSALLDGGADSKMPLFFDYLKNRAKGNEKKGLTKQADFIAERLLDSPPKSRAFPLLLQRFFPVDKKYLDFAEKIDFPREVEDVDRYISNMVLEISNELSNPQLDETVENKKINKVVDALLLEYNEFGDIRNSSLNLIFPLNSGEVEKLSPGLKKTAKLLALRMDKTLPSEEKKRLGLLFIQLAENSTESFEELGLSQQTQDEILGSRAVRMHRDQIKPAFMSKVELLAFVDDFKQNGFFAEDYESIIKRYLNGDFKRHQIVQLQSALLAAAGEKDLQLILENKYFSSVMSLQEDVLMSLIDSKADFKMPIDKILRKSFILVMVETRTRVMNAYLKSLPEGERALYTQSRIDELNVLINKSSKRELGFIGIDDLGYIYKHNKDKTKATQVLLNFLSKSENVSDLLEVLRDTSLMNHGNKALLSSPEFIGTFSIKAYEHLLTLPCGDLDYDERILSHILEEVFRYAKLHSNKKAKCAKIESYFVNERIRRGQIDCLK